MGMKIKILSAIIVFLALSGTVNIARAVPVVSYTGAYDSGTGLWTYEGTIFNDTADLLYDFIIYPVMEPASGADLTSAGWGPADLGSVSPYFVHWMADFGAEIMPGDTMGGFWFTYSGAPGDAITPLAYEAMLWDLTNNAPYQFAGETVAASSPSQVPEPATLLLLAGGILGLAVFPKVRRAMLMR